MFTLRFDMRAKDGPDSAPALYEAALEFDYLWFPMRHPPMDEVLRQVAGDDFGDNLFQVDRSGEEMTLVPLTGVFR